jgi:hypothetical protein
MRLIITPKYLVLFTLIVQQSFSVICFGGTNAIPLNDTTRNAEFDIKNASFLLPMATPPKKFTSAVFLLNIFIPPDWTLDVIKTPMFCYAAKYSLPHGFNIQANVATMFVSTRIALGPWWNYTSDNFHLGFGYQAAFNYGVLKQFGYHTTLTGWEEQPSFAVGYSFKTMAVVLRGDMYIANALYLHEGGYTVPFTNTFINGYSFTTSLEQRLVKNKVMSVGMKWSFLRYHVLAWPAFPVNSYYYAVPEVQLGLNF